MQRVSNVEAGYDFSKVAHQHWKERAQVYDYIIIIILLLGPSIFYNFILWATHDFLISQALYQIILVFLTFSYQVFITKLNFDVHYIYEVRNMNTQLSAGLKRLILFAIIIPSSLLLLKYVGVHEMNHIILMMPGGVEPKSIFPKVMHAIYLLFFFFDFCIFLPLIEFRYYFVFVQYRIDTVCTTIWGFLFMSANHVYYIVFLFMNFESLFLALILAVLVILMYLLIGLTKKRLGFIAALLQQIGIHGGLFLVLVFILFTKRIVDDPKKLDIYSSRNVFDLTFQIFFNRDDKTS